MKFWGEGFPPRTLVELRADLRREKDKIHFSSTNRSNVIIILSQKSPPSTWNQHDNEVSHLCYQVFLSQMKKILSSWFSRFLTSQDGTIDTSQQEPVNGSYVGIHRSLSLSAKLVLNNKNHEIIPALVLYGRWAQSRVVWIVSGQVTSARPLTTHLPFVTQPPGWSDHH